MTSHVAKTVSACYSALRQLRSVRRSLSRCVLQSLVSSYVLSRLDYGSATLAGIPPYLLQQLQSVMNSATRLVFSSSRFAHITPLLRQLVQARCSDVQHYCLHGTAPSYLVADELQRSADLKTRRVAALHLLVVADCLSYAAVHRRRSSLPC